MVVEILQVSNMYCPKLILLLNLCSFSTGVPVVFLIRSALEGVQRLRK